ncbi:MAG: hypothetical protein BWY78_00330 [Alphaproteobacteria bacterium ADurb.Bin438]|nr:MAG: hypothetical protein BWY78_00330 [Alphaproteobacteria bacterium ADurb.Bin438]
MLKIIKSPVSLLVCLFAIFVAKYFFVGANANQNSSKEEVVAIKTVSNGSSAIAKENEEEVVYDYEKMFPPVDEMVKEKSVGSDNAPVVLQVFSAYTCGHCGHFFVDTVPELLKNEVKEGKLKIVFEELPFDVKALRASLVSICSKPENRMEVSKMIYENAMEWYNFDKNKFVDYMARHEDLTGLNKEKINACLTYPALRTALRKKVEEKSKPHDITSTPTLVYRKSIRTYKEAGAVPYERVAEVVDKLIKNENPSKEGEE